MYLLPPGVYPIAVYKYINININKYVAILKFTAELPGFEV
jgi:hypothetical protein